MPHLLGSLILQQGTAATTVKFSVVHPRDSVLFRVGQTNMPAALSQPIAGTEVARNPSSRK